MEVYCNGTSLYLNHIITRALNAAVSPEQSQFLDIIVSTSIFFVRRITDGFKMLAYFRGTLNFNPFEYHTNINLVLDYICLVLKTRRTPSKEVLSAS